MQNAFSEGKKSVFRAASAAPPPRQLLVREVCAEGGGTAAWSEAKGPARSESLPETAPLPFVRKGADVHCFSLQIRECGTELARDLRLREPADGAVCEVRFGPSNICKLCGLLHKHAERLASVPRSLQNSANFHSVSSCLGLNKKVIACTSGRCLLNYLQMPFSIFIVFVFFFFSVSHTVYF